MPAPPAARRPIALVYRDAESAGGCSESLAALLRDSRWNFDVKYVGPDEPLKLSSDVLRTAALYAQPGGNGTLADAWQSLRPSADLIRDYTRAGGRYLGICMGGYLAGHSPGFGLLPGDAGQLIACDGASVTTDADTLVRITWRGRLRWMYFQDGPYFSLDRRGGGADAIQVLATYSNGKAAALVVPFGKGKVAVCGPHPEADRYWYRQADLADPDGPDADLGQDLIDSLMR